MRICKIPDANLRFLIGAAERLVAACPASAFVKVAAGGEIQVISRLNPVLRTLDDIRAGNPHADCHYRHRANRGMLEVAAENLRWLKALIEELEEEIESGQWESDDDSDYLHGQLANISRWDLDTCLEHLSPEALDKWEVEDEA